MSDSDGMPTAAELYKAGALANSAPLMPSAQELLNQTGGPAPWREMGGDSPVNDYEMVRFDEEDPDHGASAPLTLIPTSTTNPKRPRTVAAGYSKRLQTLTVLFRDDGKGPTLYNYYDVDPLTWANFKRARSKGRFILAYLDDHDRGYPTSGTISDDARSILSDVAREYQDAQEGFQPGQSRKSRRGLRPYGQ